MEMATAIDTRVPILLVEDEDDQAALIQDALQGTDNPNRVERVASGEAAVAYLSGEGEYGNRGLHPFPQLMLLDLRMPGMGGFGVLRWLKAHPKVRDQVDVIVLSSVQCRREIEVVYELGAQYYWMKTDYRELQHQVQMLKLSWLGTKLSQK
jgi:CheY-like chemotaxis protein